MDTILKFRSIVVYDDKDLPYSSIPVYGSMTVDQINTIIDALFHAMPCSFTIRLE